MGAYEWGDGLREVTRANLSAFPRQASRLDARRAAVAITLLAGPGGEAVLPLFRRSAALARHAGQMGLPGGRFETGEDATAAARRELEEELGVREGPDAVVGELDDFETRSGFVITPVVIWSSAAVGDLRPGVDGEIAQLHVLTLGALAAAAASAPDGTSEAFSLRFAFGNVYAPTAAMLFQFNEVALGGRLVRVRDFYQPPFTWR
ncbi:MAG: CoA pyrophosphatase [Candidatus Dormibacteraeota bacterium]|nr:CoA pyrophosphatase [Candidatus Dormibacteraeota bacterium]MBO0701429.1 CoA pyrophosphatase [Candidatus Dormibacteraeota bacterium]